MSSAAEQGNVAALAELAAEEQEAVDRAVEATAEQAMGKSFGEVEAMLRVELGRHGVRSEEDMTGVIRQIVAALGERARARFESGGEGG